jgi:hypothetical protein
MLPNDFEAGETFRNALGQPDFQMISEPRDLEEEMVAPCLSAWSGHWLNPFMMNPSGLQ